MYAPDKYREERTAVLVAAIEGIRFATLIGSTPNGPEAVHVPLVFASDGDGAWLDGHISKNNTLARMLGDGAPVLAVFNGPHAYVSPNWMKETAISGRTAPTWAYVAVQVRGSLEWRMEAAWLSDHVANLTDTSERAIDSDWSTSRMPEEYAAALVAGITGFRVRIDAMEGVWKIMQYSAPADRDRIASALRDVGGAQSLMADTIVSGVES